MSYTKQEFKSGATLYASQLNSMDEQIALNASTIDEFSKNLGNITKFITPEQYGAVGDGKTILK